MKAFVIKNKEGKYRASEVKNFSGFYYYTDKLVQAEFFSDYELAKVSCLESEEPVKITIAEGDLEKENKIFKEALIQTEEVVRKNIDFYLHKMSFQDVQQDHLEYQYWSEKCKKVEDIRKIIEQAKGEQQ